MTSLFNSLEQISDGYTVFEKDQVLTESQLNSVSQYLDDQDRLSRISLHGVGIVCGLQVSLSGSTVSLGKGVGITTDGDLIRIDADKSYNKFKAYDTQFPRYQPFYIDDQSMIQAYELLPVGETDPLAKNLNQFASTTSTQLGNMTALLLMESFIKDSDLCSSTDCDNLGQDYISKLRLILVDKAQAARLWPDIKTSQQAAASLAPMVSKRVILGEQIKTKAQLQSSFNSACNSMQQRIKSQLGKAWSHIAFLLGDGFSSDPTPAWITKIDKIHSDISANKTFIQYYYGFLNDLIETWNEFLHQLNGETAYCCPDISGFPKHLLLGNLQTSPSNSTQSENRFGFYPSAAIQRNGRQKQVVFLLQKLGALINNFSIPAANSASVKVTPDRNDDESAAKRAIPYYYKITATQPIHKYWNYEASEKQMERYHYAYHAQKYSALGAALDPLDSRIDRFVNFRIEGHIGKKVSSVLKTLQQLIKDQNLPFAVYAVLAGTDRKKIPYRKGAGYTDLHRLHYLLRQDLVHKMDAVSVFSKEFKKDIDKAVSNKIIQNDVYGNDSNSVKAIASDRNATVVNKAANTRTKLDRSYMEYRKDTSWMTDLGDTMTAAGNFKANLGKVVTTSYVTSFDHLIGSSNYNWLPWLDEIITERDDKADNKNMLHEFVKLYPGLEHTASVVRGGTFVLVHDNDGTIVADFMLSHYVHDVVEEADPEPPRTKPQIPRDDIIKGGIQINPSRDNYIKDSLDVFKGNLKFDSSYTEAFKDLINIMPGFSTKGPDSKIITEGKYSDRMAEYEDPLLGMNINRAREERLRAEYLGEKINDPAVTTEEKELYQKELVESQKNLANNLENIAKHVDKTGGKVSVGSESYQAVEEINSGFAILKENTAMHESSKSNLKNILDNSNNDSLKFSLGSILGS